MQQYFSKRGIWTSAFQAYWYLDSSSWQANQVQLSPSLLSQPNNNHNPNNKTTITTVGLRQSNHWEHPPPPPQTQNYMIEQK